jgi:hypothetical protein
MSKLKKPVNYVVKSSLSLFGINACKGEGVNIYE